jgi:hypothetical protein
MVETEVEQGGSDMRFEGGCYCGAVRYIAEGDAMARVQCHCRQCQYFSGGHPNVIIGMPKAGFRYTKGEPKRFTRSDVDNPRSREFCAQCGTHLTTLSPNLPDGVYVKVGSMDDPALYGEPEVTIQTADAQTFHSIPEGSNTFERWPT